MESDWFSAVGQDLSSLDDIESYGLINQDPIIPALGIHRREYTDRIVSPLVYIHNPRLVGTSALGLCLYEASKSKKPTSFNSTHSTKNSANYNKLKVTFSRCKTKA